MLGALLLVVGGFCNVDDVKAATKKIDVHYVDAKDCGDGSKKDVLESSIPLQDNSIMPCCVERPEKTPTISATDFSGIIKITAAENTQANVKDILLSENNLNTSSDSSPPKPDKLSSILRLE